MRTAVQNWTHRVAEYLHAFPDDHPLQIALRTYALAISLSLGPTVASFVVKPRWKRVHLLLRVIRRELGPTGLAFAITVAVAGGASLKSLLDSLDRGRLGTTYAKVKTFLSGLGSAQKTFLANAISATIAILLMHHRRPRTPSVPGILPPKQSHTLDLTLLVFVRAMDAVVRGVYLPAVRQNDSSSDVGAQERAVARRRTLAARLDAFVFWAASARYAINISAIDTV